MLHLKRANYVTRIWKQALSRYPEQINPVENGLETEKYQKIQICWSTSTPAPDAILEMISSDCKTGTCTMNRYQCHRHQLTLTCVKLGLRHPNTIFLVTTFTQKMTESSNSMYSSILMLENI